MALQDRRSDGFEGAFPDTDLMNRQHLVVYLVECESVYRSQSIYDMVLLLLIIEPMLCL